DQSSAAKWTGLRPAQLAVARHWPAQRRDELTEDEVAWIKKGILWQWIWRGAVATVVLLISGFAGYAYIQKNAAEDAKKEAQDKTWQAKHNAATTHLEVAKYEIGQGNLALG